MNTQKRNIGLDLDDVLMGCNAAICEFHNNNYGTQLVRDDIFSWNFEEVWGGTLEEAKQKVEVFYNSPEHRNAFPLPGAQDAVDALSDAHNLHIITGRPEGVLEQTMEWLLRHFPSLVHSIHFTNHFQGGVRRSKRDVCLELGIDVFVDDLPIHAQEVAPHVKNVYLLDAPWNKKHTDFPNNVERVLSWKEIMNKITNLTSSNSDQ